jgi:hypothetical protein
LNNIRRPSQPKGANPVVSWIPVDVADDAPIWWRVGAQADVLIRHCDFHIVATIYRNSADASLFAAAMQWCVSDHIWKIQFQAEVPIRKVTREGLREYARTKQHSRTKWTS